MQAKDVNVEYGMMVVFFLLLENGKSSVVLHKQSVRVSSKAHNFFLFV